MRPAQWARPTISVARDPSKLDKVFARRAPPGATRSRRTSTSRRREAVLVAAGPRSSTGYALRVESVTETGNSIDVVVREHTPSLRDARRRRA